MKTFYCPFCLESVKLQVQELSGEYGVVCLKCYANGPLSVNEEMAVGFWNRAKRKRIQEYAKRKGGYEDNPDAGDITSAAKKETLN